MVKMISEVSFARIVINGKEYNYDVVIYPDGRIERRKKHLSKKYADLYNHTPLSREELEETLKDVKPEIIIIGTGLDGRMVVMEEAKKLAEERGIELIIDLTPKAIEKFNKLYKERKVLGIFHTTC